MQLIALALSLLVILRLLPVIRKKNVRIQELREQLYRMHSPRK